MLLTEKKQNLVYVGDPVNFKKVIEFAKTAVDTE